jgi:hypothetical protein
MGVGGLLGLAARHRFEEAQGETGVSRYDDSLSATRVGNTATLFFGLGAAFTAAGAVVWLTAPNMPLGVSTNGRAILMQTRF